MSDLFKIESIFNNSGLTKVFEKKTLILEIEVLLFKSLFDSSFRYLNSNMFKS